MGAQRKALNNIKAYYKVAGMAEWYVPAIISYQAIHNKYKLSGISHSDTREEMINYLESKTLSMDSKVPVRSGYWKSKGLSELRVVFNAVKMSENEGNIFDVRILHERKLSDVDILTYSFPCQDLSQQGSRKGMSKGSGTRSGLLWEIEKALDKTKKVNLPKFLLMENVSSLLFKKNKSDLNMWIKKLESLGYKNSIGILNSAEFGSPQARRRVFMISSLRKKIELPVGKLKNKKHKPIKGILNDTPANEDFLPALDKYDIEDFKLTKSNINKGRLIGYTSFNSEAFVYDPNYTGPTLTASGANSRIKFKYEDRIRKINAKEAYRYMGFTEADFNKVNRLNYLSQNKMIYTCGNSISVEVLSAIFRKVINE